MKSDNSKQHFFKTHYGVVHGAPEGAIWTWKNARDAAVLEAAGLGRAAYRVVLEQQAIDKSGSGMSDKGAAEAVE